MLNAVAKYFNVIMDYLLSMGNSEIIELNARDEKRYKKRSGLSREKARKQKEQACCYEDILMKTQIFFRQVDHRLAKQSIIPIKQSEVS